MVFIEPGRFAEKSIKSIRSELFKNNKRSCGCLSRSGAHPAWLTTVSRSSPVQTHLSLHGLSLLSSCSSAPVSAWPHPRCGSSCPGPVSSRDRRRPRSWKRCWLLSQRGKVCSRASQCQGSSIEGCDIPIRLYVHIQSTCRDLSTGQHSIVAVCPQQKGTVVGWVYHSCRSRILCNGIERLEQID